MIDKVALRKVLEAIHAAEKQKQKKGGSIPETHTNLKQVKMVEQPVNVGGAVGGKCDGGAVGKKTNPWLSHVAKVKGDNPSMKYKDVLKKAKESYTKVGGAVVTKTYPAQKKTKTSHDYVTNVEDPVKTQDQLWNNYKQNKKVKKINLKAETKSSVGKPPKIVIIKPEKKTKALQLKKGVQVPKGVQGKVNLKINVKKPAKHFAKEIGEELRRISGQQAPEEVLKEARTYVPEREGRRVGPTTYGEEEKLPLFGKGMLTFEKELFKQVEKYTKEMTPAKAVAYARKYITDALKERGWKPIEIKPVVAIALERIKKIVGGALVEIPKTDVELLLIGLEKAGVFDATTVALKGMANKLVDVINDPKQYQKQRILTVEIPNLQTRYEKLKNIWDIKSSGFTELRKKNHTIRMLNLRSEITNRLNKLVGISMIQSSKTI